MNARRLRWWSRAALDDASAELDGAWRRWCADWDVAAGAVGAANAFEHATTEGHQWVRCRGTTHHPAWLGAAGSSAPAAVRAMLVGVAPSPVAGARRLDARRIVTASLADEVCEVAWRELQRGLIDSVVPGSAIDDDAAALSDAPSERRVGDESAPPAAERRCWSGAVVFQLASANEAAPAIHFHVSTDAAEAMPALRRQAQAAAPKGALALALATIADAVAPRRLRLDVELDGAVLDVGTLRSLRTGDVLALQHRLDEPLHVRSSAADFGLPRASLCNAYLGLRDGRRAVELSRPDRRP